MVKLDNSDGEATVRVGAVAPNDVNRAEWLVYAADTTRFNCRERFSGDNALLRSLRFAHDEYSRVRWFLT
jgi:hypothetical protein